MNKEIWKDIKGYEQDYQVSNLGKVRSIKFDKVKVLKQNKIGKNRRGNPYYSVNLCSLGKSKKFLVHKLVAEAFIPNPQNKPYVDHYPNRDTFCNNAENLRWATTEENAFNSKISKSNTSGVKGVIYIGHYNKTNPWRGQITFRGKKYGKNFSNKLEAEQWVKQKRKELHGIFSNNG
jgi:NADH:ubiquinone oxidoreductase subunit